MRKIVQVSIAHSNSFFASHSLLVVLCDDGTVWERSLFDNRDKDPWKKIQPVPGGMDN